MTDTLYLIAVIAGLTAVSALNRSFFFLSRRDMPMPDALRSGLRYAPLGALIAVVAPEVLMTNGQLVESALDARIFAAVCAAGYATWRRRDMLGTIIVGMTVFLTLRFTLGW